MGVQCGIVGLPNVGKSTLFNAVSNAGVEAANYPFSTIEPNVAVVPVPDARVLRLAELARSSRSTAATMEFVDIAGLVAGASRGEGLGNQFLGHIREVDAVLHVVRCFDDPNVAHVAPEVDPRHDVEIIETELLLKDLDTVERRIEKTAKQARGGDRRLREELAFYERLRGHLDAGLPVRSFVHRRDEAPSLRSLWLLSQKPVLFVANVSEDDLPHGGEHVDVVRRIAAEEGAPVVVLCAELEAQLAELNPDERTPFLREAGIDASGLERLVRSAYELLDLVTFFTINSKETRAWTVPRGTRAPAAAGVVHSDFERGFIRAETIACEKLLRHGSESAARDAGAMRSEGKEYVVADGDVLLFRFSA